MLIGRPHVIVFHIDKLISSEIDVAIKYMPNYDKVIFMTGDNDKSRTEKCYQGYEYDSCY